MSAILNECKEFVRDFKSRTVNFFSAAAAVSGKTFLSSAIANALLEKGVDVLYVSSNALFPDS